MDIVREDDGSIAYLGNLSDNEAMLRMDRDRTTPAERVAAVTRLRGGTREPIDRHFQLLRGLR